MEKLWLEANKPKRIKQMCLHEAFSCLEIQLSNTVVFSYKKKNNCLTLSTYLHEYSFSETTFLKRGNRNRLILALRNIHLQTKTNRKRRIGEDMRERDICMIMKYSFQREKVGDCGGEIWQSLPQLRKWRQCCKQGVYGWEAGKRMGPEQFVLMNWLKLLLRKWVVTMGVVLS